MGIWKNTLTILAIFPNPAVPEVLETFIEVSKAVSNTSKTDNSKWHSP